MYLLCRKSLQPPPLKSWPAASNADDVLYMSGRGFATVGSKYVVMCYWPGQFRLGVEREAEVNEANSLIRALNAR